MTGMRKLKESHSANHVMVRLTLIKVEPIQTQVKFLQAFIDLTFERVQREKVNKPTTDHIRIPVMGQTTHEPNSQDQVDS